MSLRKDLLDAVYDSMIGLDYFYMQYVNDAIDTALRNNKTPNARKCAESSIDYLVSRIFQNMDNIAFTYTDYIMSKLTEEDIADAIEYLELNGKDTTKLRDDEIVSAIFRIYIDEDFIDDVIEMLMETIEKVAEIRINQVIY